MRHFAITGIVTADMISRIFSGSDMRATPPAALISAGTRSSAITAHAPASSAIFACSAVTTSMITPPLSIWARPVFSVQVPVSAIDKGILALPQRACPYNRRTYERGRCQRIGAQSRLPAAQRLQRAAGGRPTWQGEGRGPRAQPRLHRLGPVALSRAIGDPSRLPHQATAAGGEAHAEGSPATR